MSAAVQVSSFQFPVSSARSDRAVELSQVVPASRLAARPAAAIVLSGIEALDALTGGLPRGGLTEICGPASSGRTSVLMAVMAKITALGEVCALVDASDSFDPKSAEAAGVELRRLLWIRCSPRRHPSAALGAGSGTENRVIGRSGDRVIENGSSGQWSVASGQRSGEWRVGSGERTATASMVDGLLDCARGRLWSMAITGSSAAMGHRPSTMDSLEQALKATDLLLQGGGFGLVVVDLGDVPVQAARRVPLTSWFRFRRAVENTRTHAPEVRGSL